MNRANLFLALALALGAATPSAADQHLIVAFHSDAYQVLDETVPAADESLTYWFGAEASRLDVGKWSVIVRMGAAKLYVLDNDQQTYSEHDLPITAAAQLVGPEVAPAVEQAAVPAEAISDVRPRDQRGELAGYTCRHTMVEVSMPLMDYMVDWCDSDELPIDYPAFHALLGVRAGLLHGFPGMLPVAQKLGGFPLRSETTVFGGGNEFLITEELRSIEERPAPAGHYDVPSGFRRVRYVELLPPQQAGP